MAKLVILKNGKVRNESVSMYEKNQRKVLYSIYESIPSEENINYAFEKLIMPLTASTGYKYYEDVHNDFQEILKIVSNWLIIYVNTLNLNNINIEEFNDVKTKLFELYEKNLGGYYIQDAYEWILQLELLINYE